MSNDGLLEEDSGWAGPHPQARFIDDVLQDFMLALLKRRQKIACRRGIRNAACAQGIEEDFVVAEAPPGP